MQGTNLHLPKQASSAALLAGEAIGLVARFQTSMKRSSIPLQAYQMEMMLHTLLSTRRSVAKSQICNEAAHMSVT